MVEGVGEGLEEEEVDLVLEQMLGLEKILELEVLVEAEGVGLEVGGMILGLGEQGEDPRSLTMLAMTEVY